MATIFTESFEGAAVGTAISASNSSVSSVIGSPVFAAGGVQGQAGSFPSDGTTRAYGIWNITSTPTVFLRAYGSLDFLPTTGTPILVALSGGSGGTTNGSVIVSAAGKFALRNGSNTTAVATSAASVPTNTEFRLVWNVVSGTQTLKIYLGANVNGGTPDEVISGAFATTATDTIEVGLKVATGNAVNARFDELNADNAVDPGPASSPSLQTLSPDSDVTTTGWTKTPSTAASFAATLGDSADTSYVQSPNNPTGTSPIEVHLKAGSLPTSRNNHSIPVRMATVNATSASVVVTLRQGSTVIATRTETGVTATPTAFTYTLTGTEAAAITDYTDLRLRFAATVS